MLRPEDWKALRTIHSSSKKADEESFFKFLFNLNMLSVKQEKMGLGSAHHIMYEYSVLVDKLRPVLTLIF